MANQEIVYDLDNEEGDLDLVEWHRVTTELLKAVTRNWRRGDGVALQPADVVNLYLDCDLYYVGRSERITLKVRAEDIYFLGFIRVAVDNRPWEFRRENDFRYLAGSEHLGITPNYSPAMKRRKIGYRVMIQAFENLWYKKPGNLESAINTIILMLFETTRSHWAFVETYQLLAKKAHIIPKWLPILVNHWSYISGIARLELPTDIKIREDLHRENWDLYDARNIKVFKGVEGPYFARLLIYFSHIDA